MSSPLLFLSLNSLRDIIRSEWKQCPDLEESDMTLIQPYEIACIQPQAHQCPSDPRGQDEAIGKNLMRQLELLDYA